MSSTQKQKADALDQFFQPKQLLAEPTSMQENTATIIEETMAGSKTTRGHRSEFDRSW